MLYALAPRSSDGNSMSYLNHGCECHAAGDYEQAIELYVKALNVRLQFFGANSLPVGQVYSLVAHTLHAAGEIEDAEDYYSRSLEIRADMLRSLEQKGLGGDFLPLATTQQALEYNNCLPLALRASGGSDLVSQEVVAAAAASVNNDMPGEMCACPSALKVGIRIEYFADSVFVGIQTPPLLPACLRSYTKICIANNSPARCHRSDALCLRTHAKRNAAQ